MAPPTLSVARYAAVPDGQMLFIQPQPRYASTPPVLAEFRHRDATVARAFLRTLARPHVDCPPEAVMLYRDALVLDGHMVIACGVGVAETLHGPGRPCPPGLLARLAGALAASVDATVLAAGPPVAAIFAGPGADCGRVLADVLPRLVHLAAMGLRDIRLLLPQAAAPLQPMLGFALHALGITAELLVCPASSVLRVPALHWVSPVSQPPGRASPALLALLARLCATAPRADGPARLYLGPPTRDAEVARRAGFTALDPTLLDFPTRLMLLAGARSVVGPPAAAMALTAAMSPGGRVALLDPGQGNPFLWDLACLAGLAFTWAFTAPLGSRLHAPQSDPALLDAVLEAA